MANSLPIGMLFFEGALGLFMAFSAYSVFSGKPEVVAKYRAALRLPRWFQMLAGTVATIGAVGLLAGLINPLVSALAAVWIVCYFIVASLAHVVRNDLRNVGMALIFLVLAVGFTTLQWGSLAPVLQTF